MEIYRNLCGCHMWRSSVLFIDFLSLISIENHRLNKFACTIPIWRERGANTYRNRISNNVFWSEEARINRNEIQFAININIEIEFGRLHCDDLLV